VYGFTPEAEAFLVGQPWPGNVRELRNVVRRAVLSAPTMIDRCHFASHESTHADGSLPLRVEATAATLAMAREQAVVKAESEAIRAALTATGGNKAAAARLLKIDYKTLWYKLKDALTACSSSQLYGANQPETGCNLIYHTSGYHLWLTRSILA